MVCTIWVSTRCLQYIGHAPRQLATQEHWRLNRKCIHSPYSDLTYRVNPQIELLEIGPRQHLILFFGYFYFCIVAYALHMPSLALEVTLDKHLINDQMFRHLYNSKHSSVCLVNYGRCNCCAAIWSYIHQPLCPR